MSVDPAESASPRDPQAPDPGKIQLEADLWDFDEPLPGSPATPPPHQPSAPTDTVHAEVTRVPSPVAVQPAPSSQPLPSAVTDAPSPAKPAASLSQLPWFQLKRKDVIGLAACALLVAAVLSGIGIYVYLHVPTRSGARVTVNFPVMGQNVKITHATTYWRAPRRTGERIDRARMDAKSIPVIDLTVQNASGVLRVHFRDDHGQIVGDPLTQAVDGNQQVSIAASAGFVDLASHTEYRTGAILPWTAEVYEGPSANSPREAFKKLFVIDVSPDQQ